MTIPVWDYRAEYEAERDDILAAVDQVLRSGRLILGDSVRAFEHELAAYCGAGHGVGVNSGTDALVLALRALDMRPGDEVITTSNTAIPTVSAIVSGRRDAAIRRHRARHVPDGRDAARIGDDTRVPAASSRSTCSASAPTWTRVHAVATRHGIAVVEDCAQSTGAELPRTPGGLDVARWQRSRSIRRRFSAHTAMAGWSLTSDEALAATDAAAPRATARKAAITLKSTATTRGSTSFTPRSCAASCGASKAYIERRRALARRYDEQLA